jgi:putative transposase
VNCGEVHSQARELVAQGQTATLVAATLAISRSSLYYRKRPRGSRADRTYDEQIVVACGEKPAYGYRRVAWWLQRKEGLCMNGKRVLRVMRERGLLVRSRRLRARRRKDWGRVEAVEPNQIWQSDMTKIWAGPAVGWAYLVSVIDCCTREIVGWNLSHRCRTEEALEAVEEAVLARLPSGSRAAHLTLTTDNGTQFTSARFIETLHRLGITHRRTAYHQQLHRAVPSQLEGRGSLDGGVSRRGRSAGLDRRLDRGVQSRPASSRSRKPHSPRGFLGFCCCTKKRGPDCLN